MGSVTGSMTVLAPGLVLATVLASGSGSESEMGSDSVFVAMLATMSGWGRGRGWA